MKANPGSPTYNSGHKTLEYDVHREEPPII